MTGQEVGTAIRARGFRDWHERTLLEGHGWLLLLIFALLAALLGVEVGRFGRDLLASLSDLGLIAVSLAVVWLSWRRYARALMLAEFVARQATCPGCRRYGFRADPAGPVPSGPTGASRGPGERLEVSCGRCQARWSVYCPDTDDADAAS